MVAPVTIAATHKIRKPREPIAIARLLSFAGPGPSFAGLARPLPVGWGFVSDILNKASDILAPLAESLPSRHLGIMKPIRKAVFPVAGLGTRFLPATKAMPKEMLPVVDRPVIQHVVDEAREAGIEHFIFVTGRNKAVIEDHFDKQFELEATLQKRGKSRELEALEA
ncbi:MAG TPA: sugar phosphate nucleotidyltransferase, partial [Xanthobacteraceae bacterium]|nr:sugar phosphate nucleotidyltransferase [Xanthobacteraceae bacterium]